MIANVNSSVSSVVADGAESFAGNLARLDIAAAIRKVCEELGTTYEAIRNARESRTRSAILTRYAVIQALFDGGFRVCEIARGMNHDHSTVHYALKHGTRIPLFGAGFPTIVRPRYRMRTRRVLAARGELAAALRAEGLSWPEVAAASGYASHSEAMTAAEKAERMRGGNGLVESLSVVPTMVDGQG